MGTARKQLPHAFLHGVKEPHMDVSHVRPDWQHALPHWEWPVLQLIDDGGGGGERSLDPPPSDPDDGGDSEGGGGDGASIGGGDIEAGLGQARGPQSVQSWPYTQDGN